MSHPVTRWHGGNITVSLLFRVVRVGKPHYKLWIRTYAPCGDA